MATGRLLLTCVQVDLLIRERKEKEEAAQSDESSKRQKEADNNAYLSLMPLALPAPPTAPTGDFSGAPLSDHQFLDDEQILHGDVIMYAACQSTQGLAEGSTCHFDSEVS